MIRVITLFLRVMDTLPSAHPKSDPSKYQIDNLPLLSNCAPIHTIQVIKSTKARLTQYPTFRCLWIGIWHDLSFVLGCTCMARYGVVCICTQRVKKLSPQNRLSFLKNRSNHRSIISLYFNHITNS